MKIIKNQKNFKINTLLESDQSSDLVSAFWDTFHDILNDSDINRIKSSYSYLASDRDINLKQDPVKDFKMILAEFEDAGWDKESLSKLFAKHGDQMAEDYNSDHTPIGLCGMSDYFMYKMTKGKAILMGYSTQEVDYNITGDEAFFKFYYGYNKTPYGRLAMEQHFGSIDAFFDFLGEHFVNFLKSEKSDLIMGQAEFMDALEGMDVKDLAQHYSYDKSGNIGTLDLKAAGVDIENPDIVRDQDRNPDYRYESNANIYQLLVEFLENCGFSVDGKGEANGKATVNDGVVKLFFDGDHA